MADIGSYLKEQRLKCQMSLKEVQERCGVTDSKLSRLERGTGKLLNPSELKKLARLYNISLVQLYIKAEYLDDIDLTDYQSFFKGVNHLSEEECRNIQTQIDLFTKGRDQK